MDSHSLHEFIIRYGQTLSSTPEFASYGRVYAPLWPIIAQLILQLEGVCTEYAVPLVVVDGKVSSYPAHPRPHPPPLFCSVVLNGKVSSYPVAYPVA